MGLAEACGLRERIEAMSCGERINTTEERAVLRAPRNESIVLDGHNAVPHVHVMDEAWRCIQRRRRGRTSRKGSKRGGSGMR